VLRSLERHPDEHPATVANLLDVVGNLLEDSPLDEAADSLDGLLAEVLVRNEGSVNIKESLAHILPCCDDGGGWRGHASSLPLQ
jgi:hypothetical protein